MGFKIFAHAIRLVIDHLGDALRISGILYVVQFAAILASSLFAVGRIAAMPGFDPTVLFYSLPLLVIVVVANLWIAVAWHRYVLLDEMPGAVLARFNGDRIGAYFGRSLLLALIAVGLAIVAGLVVSIFAGPILAVAAQLSVAAAILAGLLVFLLIYVPLAIILYRLALVLPAAAVGKPLRFGEAWTATSGAGGTIFGLALLSVVCAWLLDLPATLLLNGPLVWLSLLWQTLVGWIEVMVGVSILTTLYGHYVERRAIP